MFKQMIVAVFIIYLKFVFGTCLFLSALTTGVGYNVRFINAYPTIYLKEIDLEDNFNPKDTKTRSELLNRAINLIKREKGPQQAAVNNCILRNKDIENKLSCISDSIERSQHRPGPYSDIDDDYYEIYPEIFINHRGRSKNFSQDYLDIKDLLRSNKDSEKKRKIIFKIVNPEHQVKSSNRNDLRRFNKFVNKKILRTVTDSRSDSSDSEYSDNSKTRIHYSSDSSSEEKIQERKKGKSPDIAKIKANSVMYMQSPSRIYEARRRLPHFFPKRYHWNENEMRNLRNYWFSGPQGRYWGLHKTPY